MLELQENLGPGTVITTYIYDAANQLDTAEQGSTTWQYTYDANGSLISDGVKTYTYDSANRLTQVSDPSGTMSMDYNGLGQRLNMDAAGVIAHYVLDGDQPLTATSAGNTTYYLYGLGAIAEKTNAWSYSLPDGTNTPRQLSDLSGGITLTARYTPWGDTLDTYGTGSFTFGYFGGVMDAATGLLYVGNGQYYDPATGRFLSRDAKPNNSNPYVPWDPTGAIVGPLAAMALFFSKRKKGSKVGTLFALLLVSASVGMTLAACGGGSLPEGQVTATVVSTPGVPQAVATATFADGSTSTAVIPWPTETPTQVLGVPCQTPETPTPIVIDDYITFEGWTDEQKTVAMDAIRKVNERLLGDASLLKFLQVYNISTSTPLRFIKMNDTGSDGCAAGPNLIKCHTDYDFDDPRLIVHELGHVLSLNNPARNLYGDLLISENAIVDDLGQWVTGMHPSGPDCQNNNDPNSSLGIRCAATSGNQYRSFERTFLGYTGDGIPAVYHGTSFPDWRINDHEDYADMFMNWVYNTFDYSASAYNAGTKRYDWMDERMRPFIG